MSRYDLLEAIGNVDEACVMTAREGYKPRRAVWITVASLAACLMLTFIIPISMNILFPASSSDGQDVIYGLGESATSGMGTVTFTESDTEKHTVSFVFEKVNDGHYGLCFTGYDNDEGEIYNAITWCDTSNIQPCPDDATVKCGGFSYTVNGETADALPFSAGRYEVTVDYSGMYEYCDKVSTRIFVVGFGAFDFGSCNIQEVTK